MTNVLEEIPEDLTSFPVVFCDSVQGLVQAKRLGLPASATIRTSSPEVVHCGIQKTEPLFGYECRQLLYDYMEAGGDLTREIYSEFNSLPKLKKFSVVIARVAHNFHKLSAKFIRLTDEDFQEPRLVISVDTGDFDHNAILNPAWTDYLNENSLMRELVIKIPKPRKEWGKLCPRYRVRQYRSISIDDVIWKIGCYVSRLNRQAPRVMSIVGSHITKNAAGYMAFSGYAIDNYIRSFSEMDKLFSSDQYSEADIGEYSQIESLLEKRLEPFLCKWLHPKAHGQALTIVMADLLANLKKFSAYCHHWSSCINKRRPTVVVSRAPARTELLALSWSCREASVPLIVGQHGVAREIEKSLDRCRSIYYENTVADLFLSYNDQSVLVNNHSPFKYGESIAVGLSRDYFRPRRFAALNRKYPVAYVSTALLCGNINMLKGGSTDIERIDFEISILGKVFSRLPYGVTYKTYHYGTARYAESAVLHRTIGQYQNIELFDEPLELVDFCLRQYRVIVTGRATSTFAWCLMADRPTVYIDFPMDSPLKDNVKEQLKESVFLFSEADPDLFVKLSTFFNRDFSQIQAEWDSKAIARNQFLREYIVGPGKGAGYRASKMVYSWLASRLKNTGDPAR